MIDQVCRSEDAELYKEILAVMSMVFRPITIHELTSLIELPDDIVDDHVPLEEIIAICGSFLKLREHTRRVCPPVRQRISTQGGIRGDTSERCGSGT